MEFNELIEARRSVRKYAASEISQAELKAIVTEALEAPSWKNHGWDSLIMSIRDEKKLRAIFGIPEDEVVTAVIALGKSAQPHGKNPRKPVADVLKVS